MKVSYGRLLRTFAVVLFSLTLVGESQATPLSDAYEGMIAAAVAKSTNADKIEALGGFAAVAGSVDVETAKEINPEFTTALTSVYNAAQADLALNPALKKMLSNALVTPILDDGQKATVTQWISGLKDAAPAPAQSSAGDLSSQAKTLNASAMQQLATADTVFVNEINRLDQEADDGKRLEGIYHLLQESYGKTLGSDVQERFGRLLVKAFNEAMEIHSYLLQVLKEAVEGKTTLLAPAQITYVKKEMMPRVKGVGVAAEDKKGAAKTRGHKGKKALKKGKGKRKRATMVDADHDGKDDRDVNRDGVVSAAEKKTYADAHKKPSKKGHRNRNKKGKRRGKRGRKAVVAKPAAATVDADHDGKPDAPAVTGDTPT